MSDRQVRESLLQAQEFLLERAFRGRLAVPLPHRGGDAFECVLSPLLHGLLSDAEAPGEEVDGRLAAEQLEDSLGLLFSPTPPRSPSRRWGGFALQLGVRLVALRIHVHARSSR